MKRELCGIAITGSVDEQILTILYGEGGNGKGIFMELMVQLLGGLITYLLLAIYCREQHNEPVSISRVRELRNQIANEAADELKESTKKHGKSNKIRQLKKKKRRAKT